MFYDILQYSITIRLTWLDKLYMKHYRKFDDIIFQSMQEAHTP